jgi:hypothetical protein
MFSDVAGSPDLVLLNLRPTREKIVVSKAVARISFAGLSIPALSAVSARPALAALKFGGYQLSQLAQSSKMFESVALLLFGIGFIGLAFVVRRWQAAPE